MKYVFRGAIFNLLCVIVFAIIYYLIRKEMIINKEMSVYSEPRFTDSLFLATTVQAGIGYALVIPRTDIAKYILMIQQFLMIFTNLMLFYFITL